VNPVFSDFVAKTGGETSGGRPLRVLPTPSYFEMAPMRSFT